MHPAEAAVFALAIVAVVFGSLTPIFRSVARRIEARAQVEMRPGAAPDVADRLDRIERAVEAVAIEVERISEGQRFTTRLLSDRAASAIVPASAEKTNAALMGRGA